MNTSKIKKIHLIFKEEQRPLILYDVPAAPPFKRRSDIDFSCINGPIPHDDAWVASTNQMLDALKKYGVKQKKAYTFENSPEVQDLLALYEENHVIKILKLD